MISSLQGRVRGRGKDRGSLHDTVWDSCGQLGHPLPSPQPHSQDVNALYLTRYTRGCVLEDSRGSQHRLGGALLDYKLSVGEGVGSSGVDDASSDLWDSYGHECFS